MPQRERRYSTFGRPFRLQLSASAADGFDAPASRGQCQFPECELFERATGARFCRNHWLYVYQQDRLPDRQV